MWVGYGPCHIIEPYPIHSSYGGLLVGDGYGEPLTGLMYKRGHPKDPTVLNRWVVWNWLPNNWLNSAGGAVLLSQEERLRLSCVPLEELPLWKE